MGVPGRGSARASCHGRTGECLARGSDACIRAARHDGRAGDRTPSPEAGPVQREGPGAWLRDCIPRRHPDSTGINSAARSAAGSLRAPSGRVVDGEGKPVPGVRIRFASANPSVPFVQAVSGAQGQFTFEDGTGTASCTSQRTGAGSTRGPGPRRPSSLSSLCPSLPANMNAGTSSQGRETPLSRSTSRRLASAWRRSSFQTPSGRATRSSPSSLNRTERPRSCACPWS